ncbi:MFS transporter [Trichococcus palustris]|uniref:MFS transporter n=1 Tax=Trichococcus palustris TaxID=140314 RepID=UPI000B36141B|nr:MFS transporter [Trichococcus palustris]
MEERVQGLGKQTFYSKLDKQERYILLCCFFVFAVNGLYAMILGSFLPLISDAYGLSNTVSGTLLSAHSLGNLGAGFLAGILPVYLGRKKAIIFLCTFVILGFSIMMITGNPVLLILAFLFIGISRGSISNFNNSVVNEVSDSSPAALSFLHSIFAVGALCAPFLVIFSSRLFGEAGWKVASGVIIVLAFLSMLLFSRMKIADRTVKNPNATSYAFLKLKSFWIGAGILFFYLGAEACINGWMVKYFVDSNLMTTEYAQVLASLLWVAMLAGRLLCAFYGDWLKKGTLLLLTCSGTAVFYLLLLSTTNVRLITFAIFGIGFSMAGVYPTIIAAVGKTLQTYPMALGTLLVIGGVGSIIMPMVTGALSDVFGIFAGMSAVIVAIIFLLAFVGTYIIEEKRSERRTAEGVGEFGLNRIAGDSNE